MEIVSREGGVPASTAAQLVDLAHKIRNIREHGLTEGASTRLLIYAAKLAEGGLAIKEACRCAVCLPLTDDRRLLETIDDLINDLF